MASGVHRTVRDPHIGIGARREEERAHGSGVIVLTAGGGGSA